MFAKTRAFDDIAVHPLLEALDHALGPHYQFSAPVALQIGPGEKAQVLPATKPSTRCPARINRWW